MKQQRWIIVIAFVLIGGAIVVSRMQRVAPESRTPRSTQNSSDAGDHVVVSIANPANKERLRLKIPKQYFGQAKNGIGGERESIRFETRLPTMEPLSASPKLAGSPGSAEYMSSLEEFKNGVYVTLQKSGPTVSDSQVHKNVRDQLQNRERRAGSASRKYERHPDVAGLEKYRVYACVPVKAQARVGDEAEQCVDTMIEEYVSQDTQRPAFRVHCNLSAAKLAGDLMGCQAFTRYRRQDLHLVFRYSEIARWQAFNESVQGLLDKFVSAAEEH